ncbi:hypothetical protein [Kitasatospora aureofaciens]|uniref:hypothetical protein n=1 Tax=Kitasatospora aureofaciens TaxID=1894 RepID=UPI0036F48213
MPVAVETHHSTGGRSALIPELPGRQGYVIVTAPDEHWDAVTDPVLRLPTDFPSVLATWHGLNSTTPAGGGVSLTTWLQTTRKKWP